MCVAPYTQRAGTLQRRTAPRSVVQVELGTLLPAACTVPARSVNGAARCLPAACLNMFKRIEMAGCTVLNGFIEDLIRQFWVKVTYVYFYLIISIYFLVN